MLEYIIIAVNFLLLLVVTRCCSRNILELKESVQKLERDNKIKTVLRDLVKE